MTYLQPHAAQVDSNELEALPGLGTTGINCLKKLTTGVVLFTGSDPWGSAGRSR
jgi:hypothetical protein